MECWREWGGCELVGSDGDEVGRQSPQKSALAIVQRGVFSNKYKQVTEHLVVVWWLSLFIPVRILQCSALDMAKLKSRAFNKKTLLEERV